MLISLRIKNYALIKELVLEPGRGLNIITGETGAGKSILLGALGLLTGNRADSKTLYDETQKCIVEGSFDLNKLKLKDYFNENDLDYEETTIIRREIVPSGKSRAFINDTPVNLNILKDLGERIMDIHSQHETLLLRVNTFQLGLIDTFAQNQSKLNDYSIAYNRFKEKEKELKLLQSQEQTLKNELDYNSFLLNELETISLENIALSELEDELIFLENAEEIKGKLSLVYEYLSYAEASALNLLKEAQTEINSITNLADKYKTLAERLKSVFIELQDINHEIEVEESNIETDDHRLEQVTDSLNVVYNLQKKHGTDSLETLITIRNELSEKVSSTLNLSEDINQLKKELGKAAGEMNNHAQILSKARKDSLPAIKKMVEELLIELGMPNADFIINISEKEVSTDGIDHVDFLFSANKGINPKPLKDVASGGEFSRLMLALKYILAQRTELPTIIFDEIDTGISGEIAVKMGNLLEEMAHKMQVITITHLPQIAGKGESHFFVYKDDSEQKTVSKIKKLSKEERITEIATMIGGHNPSSNAIKSAMELLSI